MFEDHGRYGMSRALFFFEVDMGNSNKNTGHFTLEFQGKFLLKAYIFHRITSYYLNISYFYIIKSRTYSEDAKWYSHLERHFGSFLQN